MTTAAVHAKKVDPRLCRVVKRSVDGWLIVALDGTAACHWIEHPQTGKPVAAPLQFDSKRDADAHLARLVAKMEAREEHR